MRIVVKMGGNVVLAPEQVAVVADQVRALMQAGHEVALVHGGGPQLDEAIEALGEAVVKVEGLRVTSPRAAQVVLTTMDQIGARLTDQLRGHGLPARHMAAKNASFEARVKRVAAGELGRVGEVERFSFLPGARREIAVITPVGFDAEGPLNVNADEGAAAVAVELHADWLILATDVEAVRGGAGEPIRRLTPETARGLLASGAARGGMIPKLNAALGALQDGVRRVLITKVGPATIASAIMTGQYQGTLVEVPVMPS